MREVIRSNDVEIKTFSTHQIIIRGSGNSEFNNILNKKLKLLPPSDNLRIVSDDNHILAKMSFDQWNLIFLNDNKDLKVQKICQDFNEKASILATNISNYCESPLLCLSLTSSTFSSTFTVNGSCTRSRTS